MPTPHARCQEKLSDFLSRRDLYSTHELYERQITSACKLYRLIGPDDIELIEDRPKNKIFASPDLSVLVDGPNFENLDLQTIINESDGRWIGAVLVDLSLFPPAENYHIHHDPFPCTIKGELISPHPNHAQIFCHKNQTKTKQVLATCKWIVYPATINPSSPAQELGEIIPANEANVLSSTMDGKPAPSVESPKNFLK